jgi:hypothetical protein
VLARLTLLTTAAAIAALALLPASGEAAKLKYHACDGKKYQLLAGATDPSVTLLRIKMRNAKADGYAPRCLVAEAVAAEVQRATHATGKSPAKVEVYGARWGAGESRCTYEAKSGYTQAQCVHTGKDANTVRFRLVP